METSKMVTIGVIVALVVALGYALLKNDEPSLAPKGGKSCIWVDGFFNPVEETEILGGTDCTFKKDNYDSFKTGSITYTVNGIKYSENDVCTSSSLMNEYWCDNGVGQKTLGFCTLGCKISGQGGSCFDRVRVCGTAAPAEETTDSVVST